MKEIHEIDIHVGKRLRQIRCIRGVSQQALGEKLDISFQQLQKYEQGINRISAGKLYCVAQHLGVPVNYFFIGLPGYENDSSEQNTIEPLPEIADQNITKESVGLFNLINEIQDVELKKVVKKLLHVIVKKESFQS